jgi:hypothetical protein
LAGLSQKTETTNTKLDEDVLDLSDFKEKMKTYMVEK